MARFSYGYFGAQTRFPDGVSSVTLYLTVGTATKGLTAPILIDDTITVPELHWESGGSFMPRVRYVLFPPGVMYPSPIRITASNWPMTGEVVKLPGLGTKPSGASMSFGPAPAPIPVADTGKFTVISTNAGPTQVPVLTAPVPSPILMPLKDQGAPALIVPTGSVPPPAPAPTILPSPGPTPTVTPILPPAMQPQPSNLPTMPTRVQPRAPRLVDEDSGLPPGTYNREDYFPAEIYPRIPPRAGRVTGGARPAYTSAGDEEFDVQDIFIGGGRADEEGRPYPMVKPAPTGARPTSPTGYVPVKPAVPRTVDVKAETDGTVLVKVPGATRLPVMPRPKSSGAGGAGLVGVAAGAGAGFLVAGPIGAGVGAVALLLLGKGK